MTTATATVVTEPKTAPTTPSRSQIQSAFGALRRDLETRTETRTAPETAGQTASATSAEEEIFAEVSRAVEAWAGSAEGRAALQAESFDLDALRRKIDAFLESEDFAGSRNLIAEQRTLDASKISFPIQSVSLGFAAQFDFVGGLYASIGYAADIDDVSGTSVIYILGALQEGAIEGGEVAVQVGLWKNSTSQIDGYYNGQNVDITDGAGVSVFSLESGGSVVAYLVDVGAGEDDGIAEDQILVYSFDISRGPVAQQEATHFLILTQLECEKASETGHDEVYFTFQPDGGTKYRYPTWKYYSMSESSSDSDHLWNCGRSVYFDNKVDIVLWDDDDTNDDQLGTLTFNLSDFNGAGSTVSHTYDHTHNFNEVKYKMTAMLVK